jgi:uncharacterized membrane protein
LPQLVSIATIARVPTREVETKMQLHLPRAPEKVLMRTQTLRELFWILALGALMVFAFFLLLGALDPAEVAGLTIGVCVLAALWVVHAWLGRRSASEHDERLIRARERRGF